jgi:dTDP-4-amino-4,6-dideoxygalactose transaminase
LNAAGIGTGIHYSVLLHLQPDYPGRLAAGPSSLGVTERSARQILSLPMCPQLSEEVIDCIIIRIRDFLAGRADER